MSVIPQIVDVDRYSMMEKTVHRFLRHGWEIHRNYGEFVTMVLHNEDIPDEWIAVSLGGHVITIDAPVNHASNIYVP